MSEKSKLPGIICLIYFSLAAIIAIISVILLPKFSKPDAYQGFAGDFSLLNQAGKSQKLSSLPGRYRLVFFGFTNCPSICPTALSEMSQIYDRLSAAQSKQLSLVFVSVDPERDQPSIIKQYLANFAAPITGFTGSPAEIEAVTKQYGIYAEKGHIMADGNYMVNHSTLVYLVDKKGQYIANFAFNETVEMMVNKLQEYL